MVIGLLAITAIPTVTGVGNAVSAQKQQNAAIPKEQQKFHLGVDWPCSGNLQEVGVGILVDKKLHLDLPDNPAPGFKFNGYYFKYPSEEQLQGLVSLISADPPMLNWLYVDRDTHAVGYGGRKDTLGHVIGPWGWSEDEKFLTLQGRHDCWVAVREEEEVEVEVTLGEGKSKRKVKTKRWAAYWDPEGKIMAETDKERCRPIQLRRKLQLGVESRYVRD